MKKTLKSIQEQYNVSSKLKLQEQDVKAIQDLSNHISHKVSVLNNKIREIQQIIKTPYGFDDPGLPSDLKNTLRHIDRAIDYLSAKGSASKKQTTNKLGGGQSVFTPGKI